MREQTIGSDLTRYKILPPRAFAYNPMRINVGSIAMLRLPSDVLVSPDYVLFECISGELDPDYLDHVRQSHFWAHYINAGGSGSVRMRTYYDDLAALRLKLPGFAEQQKISAVLNTAQVEIALVTAEIETLTRQKRGLMQKLLTGEWRVKVEGSGA
jgi:type I restriction enzyme S subunit